MSTGSLKTGILEVIEEEAARRQRIERAAPELLAAAKVFLLAVAESSLTGDPIRADHETTVQLRAAIRKAEQG